MKVVLSYGAGTNSKAILCEMVRRGEQLDAIVFSDTGGERPETYADIKETSLWSVAQGYPPIEIVRRTAMVGTDIAHSLEDECLMRKQLPGIAYGFKSCSDKWKQQPFKKWLKDTGWTDVTVLIGFDADEPHRAERGDSYKSPYSKRYPLIEWGFGREECRSAIALAGLPQPGKSACFFCPSSRKPEIATLNAAHPDLMRRAITMEKNADLTTIKGLGRRFAWGDFIAGIESQDNLDLNPLPCGCFDGE